MTYEDLDKKIQWFEKYPERSNEIYKDSTLYLTLCQTVEDYFAEQPPERFETLEWQEETTGIMRRMNAIKSECGRIMKHGR